MRLQDDRIDEALLPPAADESYDDFWESYGDPWEDQLWDNAEGDIDALLANDDFFKGVVKD